MRKGHSKGVDVIRKSCLEKTVLFLVVAYGVTYSTISCNNTSTQGVNPEYENEEPEGDGGANPGASTQGGGAGSQGAFGGDAGQGANLNKDVLGELPTGEDQRKVLCARNGQDKVRQVFCAAQPPKISSLKELQAALGLSVDGSGGILNNLIGSTGFTFTAHSSSLVSKFTSAANPRLVMFNNAGGNVALGFVRGEQFAEIIATDTRTRELKFFLVKFTQACNDGEGKCSNADLMSPAIESNWKSVTIYEDVDVENTIFDCKQCHQPGGAGTSKIFRMQELTNPWTHFMRDNTTGGRALLADFETVHAGEEFAGVPANRVRNSDPAKLERFIRGAGNGNQPNEFPSRTIEIESGLRGSGGANWSRLYENFVKGNAIAPPFHQIKAYDTNKLKNVATSYKQYRAGNLDAAQFPDLRDVLLDSGLRDMGFMVKQGLDANGILIQGCNQCHNSKLNQNISRAKFDVNLSKMSREEKDLAIERLRLPVDDPKKMPPVRFRVLTEDEIVKLEALLKQ